MVSQMLVAGCCRDPCISPQLACALHGISALPGLLGQGAELAVVVEGSLRLSHMDGVPDLFDVRVLCDLPRPASQTLRRSCPPPSIGIGSERAARLSPPIRRALRRGPSRKHG